MGRYRNILPGFFWFLWALISEMSFAFSWNELIENAKANSPLLQSLEAERAAAKYLSLEKTSPFLPEVGLSFRNQTRFTDATRTQSHSISLDITQNVYSGFKDQISMDIAILKEEKFIK
jgi:outer membrane protein TolC